MKKLTVVFLISSFFLLSCGSKTQKEIKASQAKTEPSGKDRLPVGISEEVPTTEIHVLEKLPVRHFPVTDSTRFENFEQTGTPDTGFLKRIKFNPAQTNAKNFRLNYTIPFSNNFTSLVLTYQSGEHELFTTLITLSKEDIIIDRLDIAYDEIAESAFSKTSKIDKDRITVTDWNWMSEENPVSKIKTYILQQDGKFKLLPSAEN